MRKKTHYDKAADEIIYAAKKLVDGRDNWLKQVNFRKGRKLLLQMLKENFIPRKSNWK